MKKIILLLIRFYQRTSFFHAYIFRVLFMSDAGCRFKPTFSNYMYQAVEKYGSAKGVWLGLKRIVRCHPWNKGGYDPVK